MRRSYVQSLRCRRALDRPSVRFWERNAESEPAAASASVPLPRARGRAAPSHVLEGAGRLRKRHVGGRGSTTAVICAVVSESLQEALEFFPTREEAEAIVQAWDREEPDQAGALRVERVDFRTGTAN